MCIYTACLFSDVNLNATKDGMARVVEASVFASMMAVVIMSLVHVTVLQDGRYRILFTVQRSACICCCNKTDRGVLERENFVCYFLVCICHKIY